MGMYIHIRMSIGYGPYVEPERQDRFGGDAPAGAADEAHQKALKRAPPHEKTRKAHHIHPSQILRFWKRVALMTGDAVDNVGDLNHDYGSGVIMGPPSYAIEGQQSGGQSSGSHEYEMVPARGTNFHHVGPGGVVVRSVKHKRSLETPMKRQVISEELRYCGWWLAIWRSSPRRSV